MEIKHVFLDLDHTLWDFEKNSALTFEKIFKENNVNLKIEDFLKVYIPLNLKYWKMYREEKISKEALRYERLKSAFDAINYTVSDDLIHQLADDYIKYLSSFNHLFEGAIELFNQSDISPEHWIDKVASKGGTTRAALDSLEDNNVHKLIHEAAFAAFKRAVEIGEESSVK